jgi:glycosyltransferase involved in cell wall biosynthesis
MKICMVRDYIAPAKDSMGAERIMEALAKAFIQNGHEVCLKIDPTSVTALAPVVTDIPLDCDIIHFNQVDCNLNHDQFGIPWVGTCYGGGMEQDPKFLSFMNGNPHIVCVSKFVADRLNCSTYIWNPSDPEQFTFREKKDDYFLWIAGTDWGEDKGLFTTIRMAKKLRFNLKIAGIGKNQQIIEMIKSMCDDKITYVGAVNGQFKADLIARAKALFVLTKLPDACPTVVGEAMLSGTPVIASIFGSMPELIEDGTNGYVCKTESDICRAILSISKINPWTCRDIGFEEFNSNYAAETYLQYFENMILFNKLKK